MIDHQRARGGGVLGGVEGGFDLGAVAALEIAGLRGGGGVGVGGEDVRVFFVQVADFFGDGLDGYTGVWGQVGQVLGAFGVGDEFGGLFAVHFFLRALGNPFVRLMFFSLERSVQGFVWSVLPEAQKSRLERPNFAKRALVKCLFSANIDLFQGSTLLPSTTWM